MSGTTTDTAAPTSILAAATAPAAAAPVDAATAIIGTATTATTQAVDPAAKPATEPPAAVTPPAVPEVYEFKTPEGVTLDKAQVEAFTPLAKELGLTQDQAQKLVDLQLAQTTAAQTAQQAAWQQTVDAWAAETRADKEIGGAQFDANIGAAAKAIDKFGSPALRQALDTSGMGNHPAFVKFCVAVGKQMSEGTFASGNAGSGGAPKTAAEILFPGLK